MLLWLVEYNIYDEECIIVSLSFFLVRVHPEYCTQAYKSLRQHTFESVENIVNPKSLDIAWNNQNLTETHGLTWIENLSIGMQKYELALV